ncbi:MAG: TIGR04255 family protein [Elusimicrobia bacterium]|nr:TIGR04255 family protein [Elusimicrobiota bacterium]
MPSYKKPTITEIYSEIFLERRSLGDSECFDLVPRFKAAGLDKIEMCQSLGFPPQSEPVPSQGKVEFVPRIRCWSPDKIRLAQVSRDVVTINLVGQYPGWTAFQNLFDSALTALTSVVSKEKIKSISLHTIDKFEAPTEGFTLGKYLTAGGERIPAWYADVKDSCDINLGMGFVNREGYNKKLNIALRRTEKGYIFRINSEIHYLVKQGQVVKDLLEGLHEESNETFESVISDATRNTIMGGTK